MSIDLEVDEWILKTAQIYSGVNSVERLPINPKWRRYQIDQGKVLIDSDLEDSCWRMWHSAVITWDGQVVPCCFDKDAKHVLGDLKENRFSEIWHSLRYNELRNGILSDRRSIDICANCSEGCKVWIEPSQIF